MSSLPATFVEGFHDEETVRKMQYYHFGRTGRLVSAVSLGASSFAGVFHEASEQDCRTIVLEALQAGVNVIDTAPWYGHGKSEEVLGRILRDIPRNSYYLHTKVGRYNPEIDDMFDFRAERVLAGIEDSMRRLGVDYIDTIQVHDVEFAPNLDIILRETLPALDRLRTEGKVGAIGISGYPPSVLAELAQNSSVKLDMCLSYARFTMHDTSLAASGALDTFRSLGMGVVNAAPVAMGVLTMHGPPDWHPARGPLREASRKAAAYCEEKGLDLGRLAFLHSMEISRSSDEGEGMTVMVSTANVARNRSNLAMGTGDAPLTEAEQEAIAHIREHYFIPLEADREHMWEGEELQRYWERLGKHLLLHKLYPSFTEAQ